MSLSYSDLAPITAAMHNLKHKPRRGWLSRDIKNPESIAAHSHGVVMLVMMIAPSMDVDLGKCLQLAAIHDLCEAYTIDYTPDEAIPKMEKHAGERAAMGRIFADHPHGADYIALWMEYEEGATPEAQLVKDIDKLEASLQAMHYKDDYPEADFAEWFETARNKVKTEIGKRLVEQVAVTYKKKPENALEKI